MTKQISHPESIVDTEWVAEHINDAGVVWSRSTSTPAPTTRATFQAR